MIEEASVAYLSLTTRQHPPISLGNWRTLFALSCGRPDVIRFSAGRAGISHKNVFAYLSLQEINSENFVSISCIHYLTANFLCISVAMLNEFVCWVVAGMTLRIRINLAAVNLS